MAGRAVISLTTGLEDPEKVTVAFLVAVGAAESGRPTQPSATDIGAVHPSGGEAAPASSRTT
jgi:hypothetical protein